MRKQDFEQRLIAEMKELEYYALSLTKDKELAADLVQDTLLKALIHQKSSERFFLR